LFIPFLALGGRRPSTLLLPHNYGYSLDGDPINTGNGIKINLIRNTGIGTMFGNDFKSLIVEAEYQTNERVRVKIR
jgi:hypothetical protein